MRAMLGLVSLLVTMGIILWLFSMYSIPAAREGKKAQEQSRQISGRGEDGRAAIDSFKVEPQLRGNQLQSLEVTDVTPGGALASYGLQKGDQIVQVNGTKVGDLSNNDAELAKAQIHDAFRASQPIVVLRNGRQLTLPQGDGVSPPAPGAQNTGANPLDSINNSVKIPTH
jgi:S1-C subfamily serine protease